MLEERLEARAYIDDNRPFSQWPIIDRYEFDWGSYDLIIEPGQTFQYTMEFVMQKEISTVAIGSFFYNSNTSGVNRRPEGWGVRTVYDIVDL